MKSVKGISLILTAAVTLGCAGCVKDPKAGENAPEEIDKVISSYTESLNDFDAKGIISLTDWEDDDKDYGTVKALIDENFYKKTAGSDALEIYKYIASTVTIDYDEEDLNITDKSASVKVTYKIADWKEVFAEPSESYEDALESLKNQKSTLEVSSKISFVLKGGEWKITKLPDIGEVFAFVYSLPVLFEPNPTGIVPTDTEPAPSWTLGTDFTDSYESAIAAYTEVLKENGDSISSFESAFNTDKSVGLYDINGDGLPELYFLKMSVDNEVVQVADLCFYSYFEYAGEAMEVAHVPSVVYNAAGGGEYILFGTDKELLIVTFGGEESLYRLNINVFDFLWNPTGSYTEEIRNDYVGEDFVETRNYFEGNTEISKDSYESIIKDYVDRTEIVAACDYIFTADDIFAPLQLKPGAQMMNYVSALDYLKILQ